MKIYTFPVRVAGTNIFVSHINDIQASITYLSQELTNGIGTQSDPRVFKVAAAAAGYASFNIPAAAATPTAPASGDVWNDAGTLKFYNGSSTKTITYSDHTHSIGDVSNLQSSLDLKAALASPTFTGTVTAPIIESGRLNLDYGDFGGTVKAIRWRTTAQSAGTDPLGAGLYQANNNTLYIQAGTANSIIFRDYNTGLGANVATLSTGTTPTFTVNTGSFTTLSATSINATTTLTQNGTAVSLSGHTHAAADTTSGTFDIARIPTGTTSSTVSLGNHTHALDDLSDVTLTSVTTDQVLKWNGTAWVNDTVSGGGIGSLGSNGLVVQTATTPTYAARTITGTSNEIEVTNGNGVAGNPTIGLPDSVAIATALTLAGKTINTSTGVGVLANWAVKSYTGTSVTTTTTSLVTTTLTLVNNIVYDVIAYAGAQGNAPSGGFIDLLVDIGTAADETGSRAGTASGERPIFAFDKQTITGTGSAITIAMKGKTTTGTGSVSSGILIAIAFPRGPVMS